jgi:hypothetical protein
MGKRGPQPKGEYGRKTARTAVLSTRLQPDTRARLLEAAKANRRSLSQELEHRLRFSFIKEDSVIDFYGSQRNAAILKLLGAVIQVTCTSWLTKTADGWVPDLRKDPSEWLRDPKLFDSALTAIFHALMWFKPGKSRHEQSLYYNSTVEQMIDDIRASDPSTPIRKRSARQHAMSVLKDELGDLVDHPHPYDELLKREPPTRIGGPSRGSRGGR